jgi:DNA-binding CsgD family transcriptional regulator
MNAREMVARLNDLDEQLCCAFRVPRSGDAATLDEAITMAAATTDRLLAGERSIREYTLSPIGPSTLAAFLAAQVEARVMRAADFVHVVRSLTEGIRRMKKAGSMQGLGRQACTELCDVLGFDNALLSLVGEDGFVVEDFGHGVGGPTIIARRECLAERDCIRLRDTICTNESDVPAAPGYRELLRSGQYLVAPVIAGARVVAILHVSRQSEGGVSVRDVDVLDSFASAYSLLHERMLNTERVQQQRTSIARAAARLTEEVDRIAAAAISLDVEYDNRVEPPTIAPDSALAATLSDRERQVFERLVLGESNAEIADELVITVETVKTHVKRILRKIGAINRSEAIALYMEARPESLRYSV